MASSASHPDRSPIRAWHAHIDHIWPSTASHARALAWLSDKEQERYGRFRHDADREMFLLGRAMARTLVGRALGVAPESWPWCEGPRGRPDIGWPAPPVSFNVAHSGNVVVCAIAEGTQVGIDVEDRTRAALDRALVHRYCSPEEAHDIESHGAGWQDRFLKYWTLKEAYLKATGLGIAVHLADLSFAIGHGDAVSVEFRASLSGTDPNWTFDLRQLSDAYYVAMAASVPSTAQPTFTLDPLPAAWLP